MFLIFLISIRFSRRPSITPYACRERFATSFPDFSLYNSAYCVDLPDIQVKKHWKKFSY